MPRAQKGQRFGGRTKGIKNKQTIAREIEAAAAAERARGKKERDGALTVLERLMIVAEGAAGLHRPPTPAQIAVAQEAEDEAAKAERREPRKVLEGNWALFGDWWDRAAYAAKELARYQAPQLRAVMVSLPAEQQQPKVIEHEREPADAQERTERASRAYLTLVKGGRTDAA